MHDVKSTIATKITRFLPPEGLEQVVQLIVQHRVRFRITKPRKTKFGDYRSPVDDGYHCISVNGNLNPFAFYLTTIHEFAHLIAFSKFGRLIAPHGQEWKDTFSALLTEGKAVHWFPSEVQKPLQKYIRNPKASSASDQTLFVALRLNDKKPMGRIVKDVGIGERFHLAGREFERGELLRKRVKCKEIETGKLYLVNAIAEVQTIKNEK